MLDKLKVRKIKTPWATDDYPYVWQWELRDKDGVYGSLETWQQALAAGLDEWRQVYPEDFRDTVWTAVRKPTQQTKRRSTMSIDRAPFHMQQAIDELKAAPPGANLLYAGYVKALVHSQLAIADAIERQTRTMMAIEDENRRERR